ncbi:hypothetical protein FRC04_004810 [Tulasnella sp. 424]|nr:hypothetical protein FRC04_004810 [Tulasnella sp. 424]KAG8965139.1 hypothetical protein FRC05_003351 [Tulasnella sp. 425]
MSTSRGMPYFFNTETNKSIWDAPSGLSEEDINGLPGAHYLNGISQSRAESAPAGQVRASHLLVKHRGSRRPASWKESNITRSKEEAIEILRGYQKEIDGDPQKFAELASLHSDCSSHSADGDLGWFGKGQMQKPFEQATFGLQVGQMSDVVDTDSGVHLILRTG